MNSLRSRLIVGLLAGITLFLAFSGTLIYREVHSRMYREVDQALATIARSTASRVQFEVARHLFDHQSEEPLVLERPRGRGDLAFQGWAAEADFGFTSEGFEDELPRGSGTPDEPLFRTVELSSGAPGRMVGMRFAQRPIPGRGGRRDRPPEPFGERGERGGDGGERVDQGPIRASEEGPGFGRGERGDGRRPPDGRRGRGRPFLPEIELALVRDTTELESTLGHLRLLLVLAWVVSSLGCAGILWWGVSRGLRPLGALRRQLGELDEAQLDHRFELADTPTELQPVVDQLNQMLERMGRAFEQEQAFSGYAAHELRTPLAGLRSTLEVTLSRERDGAEHRQAAQQCLDITREMQTIVDDLLEMARAGSPSPHPPGSALLVDLVEEAWQPVAQAARRGGHELVVDFEPELDLESDLASVRRILANLFENAVSYADEGSDVRVRARVADGTFELAVSNDARSAPKEIAERAFDALWRGDPSRTHQGHTGLGLALCRRLARTLGGRMSATFESPRIEFRLELPAPDMAQVRGRRAMKSE